MNEATNSANGIDLTESNAQEEHNNGNDDFREGGAFELDPAMLAEEIDLNENGAEEDGLRNVEIEEDPNDLEIRGLGNVKKCTVNPIAIN